MRKHPGRGAARARVGRRVFGERRSNDERRPCRIGSCIRIVIRIGQCDRRNRPPGDIRVFRIPAADHGIGHGQIHLREQAGSLQRAEVMFRRK